MPKHATICEIKHGPELRIGEEVLLLCGVMQPMRPTVTRTLWYMRNISCNHLS